MLPAGLRGFASRVGRLALRAFAWNKEGAESCAAATSDSDSLSSSATTTDARISATTAARTARPARTLLRALLAMLLAAATLLAMLILPPVNKANAYDIYWEYRGEGYLVATSEDSNGKEIRAGTNNARYASGAAWFDGPSFSSDGKTVTWKVVFNPQTYYNASRVDTKYEGNIDDGKGTNRPFGENPIFYAYLPKGVSNINLVRYKYYVERDRRNTSWIRRGYESGNINTCNFSDGGCNTYWNNSVGPGSGETGVGGSNMSKISYNHPNPDPNSGPNATSKYSAEEIYKWKDEGKFGVGIVDKQSLSYTSRGFIIAPGYEWELSARLDNGYTKDDFYKMPFIFGVTSDNDRSKGKGNYRKNKFAFAGPFDTDGDGIPDKLDYLLSMHPNDNDQIKYPEYSNSTKQEMLSDFWGAKTGATYYGGGSNVPITSYGIPISVKPFAKIWDWNKNDPIPAHFNDNWNAYKYDDDHPYKFTVDEVNKTTTDLPNRVSTTKPKIGMDYSFYGNLPSGVKEDTGKQGSPCSVSRGDKGCVKINHDTGEVTYNPLISDWKRKTGGQDSGLLTFPIEIKYPAPGSYNLVYGNTRNVKRHNLTIRVLSQATQYSPHYDETEVDFHATGNNGKDSAKPYNKAKDGCNARKPLIDKRGKDLPSDVKFIFPDKATGYNKDKYIFGDSKNPVGESRLSWASLTGKDPLRNTDGIVHFAPSKVTDSGKSFADGANNGNHTKTPVVVKYADGSSSEDLDAGNICSGSNGKVDKAKSVVYAPVHVKKYPPDVSLDIWEGGGMHGVYSGDSYKDSKMERRYSEDHYKEITSIDAHKKIILDSWAKDGDGKIDFRAVCHRTDKNAKNTNAYSLLTPPNNKGKGASGSINGVKFTGYRSWDYANKKQEEDCKKNNTCNTEDFAYNYLTSDSYNVDTLQRSRAVIDGKKFSADGKYECKVFAFHEGSESLKKFDGEAKEQAKKKDYSKLFDFGNKLGKSDQKGKEWTDNTFTFSVKLKDNQKYNPTYKTIPTIQAGTFANKETNSSGQPKSHTKITVNGKQVNANGVPDDDLGGVEDGKALPPGTWFEIKKLIKKVDNKKPNEFPSEKELWSNFEGGEDNKADGKQEAKDKTATKKGSVTFRPDKWKDAGQYWAEVVVHYPDGSASSDDDSINYKHPVYAKVNVTRDDNSNRFGLDLYEKYEKKSDGKYNLVSMPNDGLTLKNDKSLPNDATFDSYLTKSVGPIHLHMICSKKAKDGNSGTKTKQTEYTYNRLPGHDETNGLRLKKQTIWGHATFEQQKSCIKDSNACTPDKLLYDDWVPGGNSNNTAERTRGFFNGKAQKTGDYECKVYAIKGDQKKSDAFAAAVKKNIENNKKNKNDVDPVDGVLKTKDNKYPYGEEGKGYKTGAFSVHIHNDNQLYNPTYTTIPEIEAGSTYNAKKALISSGAPQSKKKVKDASGKNDVNANGVPDYDLQNVKEGPLPKGTWYEIKRFVKAGDISDKKVKDLPWANFEDGEDNKADGKQEAKDKNATGKGSVTFRPDKWQDDGDYWAEIKVHYPDGSTSDGEGSINKDHPIYAKVTVTRPKIKAGDLHLNVYKQFDRKTYNVIPNAPVDSTDNIADIDSKVGVTVMRGIGLLNDLGVDSWSTAKRDGITLRTLCRDANSPAKGSNKPQVWSENLDKLFFKLNGGDNQKLWGRANFQQQEKCRKGSNNGDGCDTDVLKTPLLFDSTANTMERSRGFISNSKAPTETGKYYCAVFALKLKALGEYKAAVQRNTISVPNNSDIVSAMGFSGTNGIDYAAKFFPVNVVEPFKLPKTGGEDCVNWNMLMSVVCVLGTGVMAAGFFLDQTKWGRAMLEALLRKAMLRKAMLRKAARGAEGAAADCTARTTAASTVPASLAAAANRAVGAAACDHAEPAPAIKSFIRKTAEWCGGVMLRIEWWITERWRC